jgi:hypothetical protein
MADKSIAGQPSKRPGRRPVRPKASASSKPTRAGAARRSRRDEGTLRSRGEEPPESTVAIELTPGQVDQVIRAAGQGGTISLLLSALKDPEWMLAPGSDAWTEPPEMEDRRLSRSLLSGLLVLSCFPGDGGYIGIGELARMLDMNTSTTHRYVSTLLAVGLLERDPSSRRYRVASR